MINICEAIVMCKYSRKSCTSHRDTIRCQWHVLAKTTWDFRSRSASAASRLQPIAAGHRACVIAKNCALLSNHGWHRRWDACITWVFCRRG